MKVRETFAFKEDSKSLILVLLYLGTLNFCVFYQNKVEDDIH